MISFAVPFTYVISDYYSFSLHRLRQRGVYEIAGIVINIIRSGRSHYPSQTSPNFFRSMLDGWMCEQEQIINPIVRHLFLIFSRYVDSERNHHHFHLLAVEHEQDLLSHFSKPRVSLKSTFLIRSKKL
jgi:hypothetical protein